LSFRRLGELALQLGHPQHALRLSMVSYVIHKALGHGDSDRDLKDVQRQATTLQYTPAETEALLASVQQEYLRERAKTLLKETFGP
jgi:uncharacterized protein YcgL (UPF0745 family)